MKAGLKALISLENHKRPTNWDKSSVEFVPSTQTSKALENRQMPGAKKVETTENPVETFHAIMEIAKRCAALPDQDTRSEDDILGNKTYGHFHKWL